MNLAADAAANLSVDVLVPACGRPAALAVTLIGLAVVAARGIDAPRVWLAPDPDAGVAGMAR